MNWATCRWNPAPPICSSTSSPAGTNAAAGHQQSQRGRMGSGVRRPGGGHGHPGSPPAPQPRACNQQTKSPDPPSPRSEPMYVVLPGHPLYGRCVPIVRRRTTATATHYLIADPDHPTFCYQILARWLSTQPPAPAVSSAAAPRALVVSLVALDRLVRFIRAKHPGPPTSAPHDSLPAVSNRSALGPASRRAQSPAQRAPVFLGAAPRRRFSP